VSTHYPQTPARLICPDKTVFDTAKLEVSRTITVTYQDSALTPYSRRIFKTVGGDYFITTGEGVPPSP
jgi:hypothetical protein